MKRFRNILVVYTNQIGDAATLARAVDLAKANRARLKIVEVLDERSENALVEERRLNLERMATSVQHEGVESSVRVLMGNTFLEITREVIREQHDLVLITAEGRRGLRGMIFGSTSLHLMRKCPCPVWVTKETNASQPEHYSGVLAAIDLRPSATGGRPLDLTILELASSLARREESPLVIVHAWELIGDEVEASRAELTAEARASLLAGFEEERRRQTKQLLDQIDLDGLDDEVLFVRGEPNWVIPEIADDRSIEITVMGTLSRTGVPGFFIGNTAETVLQQVDCAVMTVKPEGFVSPVLDETGIPLAAATEGVSRAS